MHLKYSHCPNLKFCFPLQEKGPGGTQHYLSFIQPGHPEQAECSVYFPGRKGVGSDTVAVAGSILNSVFAHDLFSSQNFTFWSLITFFFFCRPKIFL